MSDINEELRNAVTAREEVSPAIGQKRSRDAAGASSAPPVAQTKRLKAAIGLDMEALQHDFAAERAREGERIRNSYRTDTQLSAEAASRMAFRLMEYIMKEQLGGRHNAVTTTQSSSTHHDSAVSLAANVAVERASLRTIAGADVSYICTGIGSADDAWVGLRKVSPAAAPLVAYRKSLRPCDMRMDLVGGVTAGLPPHSRQHWQRTVEAALRGESLIANDDPTPSSHGATANSSQGVKEAPMDLFASSSRTASNAVKEETLQETKPLFSVADFLNAASSSSENDDE